MCIGIILTFSIFLCMISLWIRWRRKKMSLFQRYGIPGPAPNLFFGNLIEFNKGRYKCIEEWLQQYGKMFGFYLGGKPYLVCADVEFLKICQIKDSSNFYNKDWILSDFGNPDESAFNMIRMMEDNYWRKKFLNIVSSCFSIGKIKLMSNLVFRPVKIFLQNIEKQGEKPFNIAKYFRALMFDIIATTSFGVTTNVQGNENNKFIKSVQVAFESDSSDILAGLSICFPELEPICMFIRHRIDSLKYMLNLPAMKVVNKTCRNIIESRKKLKHPPQDLLQSIIDTEDQDETVTDLKKLPDDFVIANALLFMLSGYLTTSYTLTWCIYHLTCNPEIQEKVRQEIKNNVKDDVEIQYSDLSNFKLLDQVISETLRLWKFNFLVVNRICSKDYHYKGITIPKGCRIAVPVQVLQSDPQYWNEPDKFDPERFSSNNRGEIDSIIYQPFGAGPRNCIGQKFARTVMKLVIGNLLRSFKLEIHGEKEIELEHDLVASQPKNGISVKATQLSY